MGNNIKSNDFQKEIQIRGEEYRKAINRVLDSGWFILGNEVNQLEDEYAKYLGVKHCIGVANGLEALQISLMALDIGKGDEVITTPLSAMATTLSIMAVGATPVFCDVDERGQLDVYKIESLITPRTKVILPVDLYGLACHPDKISEICKKHGLKFVEDACQAHGSIYKGKYLGTFGEIAAFSFYPTKNLGALGDGGAIITDDDILAEKCRCIRDYGQSCKYVHSTYGLNSRLDELQAGILRSKLTHLDSDNSKRREHAKTYKMMLKDVDGIRIITDNENEIPNYHQFVIRTPKRDELQQYLKDRGIASLVHYPLPLSDQPLFGDKYKNNKLPNVKIFAKEILSLPIHPFLNNNEIEIISMAIKDFFKDER